MINAFNENMPYDKFSVGKKLMIAGHMDEIGFIVQHVDDMRLGSIEPVVFTDFQCPWCAWCMYASSRGMRLRFKSCPLLVLWDIYRNPESKSRQFEPEFA